METEFPVRRRLGVQGLGFNWVRLGLRGLGFRVRLGFGGVGFRGLAFR